MFATATLTFLRGLKRHNDRAWFEAHRAEYEAVVKQPMRHLIEEMDVRLARLAPEIVGDPKRSIWLCSNGSVPRPHTQCGAEATRTWPLR